MAISFPTSPSIGQTHAVNGIVWTWNGSSWEGFLAESAQPFDQDLNTTDNVTFNKATITGSSGIEDADGLRITNFNYEGTVYVGSNMTQTPVSVLIGGAGPRSEWAFTPDGKLTLPDNGAGLAWNNPDSPPTPISGWLSGSTVAFDKDLGIVLSNGVGGVGGYSWILGKDGKLKLPANGDIVDTNGNSVLGSGGVTSYNDLTDKPTIPTSTSQLTNDSGFITSISTPTFEIRSSNFTADPGKYYAVNTSGGSVTVTLPTSPTTGQSIQIVDAAGTWSTNKVYVIPANDVTHPIIYSGTTYGNGTTYSQFNFGGVSVSLFWTGTAWRRWL